MEGRVPPRPLISGRPSGRRKTQPCKPSISGRRLLPPGQYLHSLLCTTATGLCIRHESCTHRRPQRRMKNGAALIRHEIHASNARRLAFGHTGNRGTDRRRHAARTTPFSTLHIELHPHCAATAPIEPRPSAPGILFTAVEPGNQTRGIPSTTAHFLYVGIELVNQRGHR